MTTQTRIIRVKVETRGDAKLARISRQMGRLNRSTKQVAVGLGRVTTAIAAFASAISVREITRSADQFQLLQDRIKVFVGSAEAANNTFNKLVLAARATRTSVASLAEVYNRVALSTKELGLGTEEVIAVTTALQQSFRLSGATIAEATAATIQLTQGLSSGQLRGQELRSVLESNAVFAGILAKELNTTRGQLIKFAESGKITSDRVLKALSANFTELNKQASELQITFEQAAILGLDQLRVKIADLNQEFGLSSKFQQAVEFLIKNLGTLFQLVSTFVATATFVKLATQFTAFVAAVRAGNVVLGSLAGPIGLAAVGITAFGDALGKAAFGPNSPKTVAEGIKRINEGLQVQRKLLRDAQKEQQDGGLLGRFFGKRQERAIRDNIKKAEADLKKLIELRKKGVTTLGEGPELPSAEDFLKKLEESFAKFIATSDKLNIKTKITEPLEKLNRAFLQGVGTTREYLEALDAVKLDELNKKFREGKIDILQYNKELGEVATNLTFIQQASLGVEQGLIEVARSAGNVAANVAAGVKSTFNNLENSIVEFVKNGKFEFAKFTQAVLEDLTRIIIRAAIIAPLANALVGGAFAGSTPSAAPSVGGSPSPNVRLAAKGLAVNSGNVIPFANGGIVGSPTFFPLRGASTGLMGEAGPEAILPLRRGPGGRLGVEAGGGSGVTVNVINNSGGEVEQRQRSGPDGGQIIDILIKDTVKEGINTGEFDSSLGEVFGLRRRGR